MKVGMKNERKITSEEARLKQIKIYLLMTI